MRPKVRILLFVIVAAALLAGVLWVWGEFA